MKRVINAANTMEEITWNDFKKKLKQYGFNYVRYDSMGSGTPEIYATFKVNEESVVFILAVRDSGIPVYIGISTARKWIPNEYIADYQEALSQGLANIANVSNVYKLVDVDPKATRLVPEPVYVTVDNTKFTVKYNTRLNCWQASLNGFEDFDEVSLPSEVKHQRSVKDHLLNVAIGKEDPKEVFDNVSNPKLYARTKRADYITNLSVSSKQATEDELIQAINNEVNWQGIDNIHDWLFDVALPEYEKGNIKY